MGYIRKQLEFFSEKVFFIIEAYCAFFIFYF